VCVRACKSVCVTVLCVCVCVCEGFAEKQNAAKIVRSHYDGQAFKVIFYVKCLIPNNYIQNCNILGPLGDTPIQHQNLASTEHTTRAHTHSLTD